MTPLSSSSSASVLLAVVMASFKWLLSVVILLGLSARPAGSSASGADPRPSVKLLAVFDQGDVSTMERVMHKTLIALNKEKTSWSVGATFRPRMMRQQRLPAGAAPDSASSSLAVESAVVSVQWWGNQSAEEVGRLFAQHRPAAVLVLSSDEHSVFRVALAAAAHHLPVIGVRARQGLDDSSFQVSHGHPIIPPSSIPE